MSDVRTYRAASMQAALDVLRKELGSDAVILHTRHLTRRRFLPWLKAKQVVEITASPEVKIAPPAARLRSELEEGKPAIATTVPARQADADSVIPKAGRSTPTATADTKGAVTGALSRPPMKPRKPRTGPTGNSVDESPVSTPSAGSPARNNRPETGPRRLAGAPAPRTTPDPSHRRPAATPTTLPARSNQAAALIPPAKSPAQTQDPAAALSQKLDSLQKMLDELRSSVPRPGAEEIPAELFHLYAGLIEAEVETNVARELIFKLKENATQAQLRNPDAAQALLTALVESEIRTSGPITLQAGRRKVVALVGPTGVGKTTTIAKLAASFRLRDGVKMGLVTVDTYRIAAVEQLKTYAEIIDLPMKVVTNALEMRRALDELAGLDLVLIDTAGRSPRDEPKIQELKSLLAEAHVDEVQLVLSLTSSIRSLEATARNFAPAKTTSMILTKLDEAAGLGTLLSAARHVGLPISYLTTGQDVPDDFEPANATRVARLVLGRERLLRE